MTSPAYQPLLLAARSGAPVMVAFTVSMLTVAESVWLLPALSTAEPATSWSLPLVLTSTSSEQVATPERTSAQSKATVTGSLFQPLPFGAGVTVWLMVGR